MSFWESQNNFFIPPLFKAVKTLIGPDVAPFWILDHGFKIDKPPPKPTTIIPTAGPEDGIDQTMTSTQKNDIIPYGNSSQPPSINCSGCTININGKNAIELQK